MGHMITFVAKPAANAKVNDAATAEEITELEQMWAEVFSITDDQWGHWKGASVKELAAYKARANGYLRNRSEGALNLREVRRQNLPAGEMRFVIAPYTKGETE
jgi:hypothetical protein